MAAGSSRDTPNQAVSIRSVLVLPVCSDRLTPSTRRRSDPAVVPVAGPESQSTCRVCVPAVNVTQAPVSAVVPLRSKIVRTWAEPALSRYSTAKT